MVALLGISLTVFAGGMAGHGTIWLAEMATIMMNPLFIPWHDWKLMQWRSSYLNEHWLLQWAPSIHGNFLFVCITLAVLSLLALYMACLLYATLSSGAQRLIRWICRARIHPQQMPTWDNLSTRAEAVQDLLKIPKDNFVCVHTRINPAIALTKDEFPRKIRPVTALACVSSVALVLLDVGLDINTVFTFLIARQYYFAAVTTFLVSRGALKQLSVLPPWRFREANVLLVQSG